MIEDCDCDFVNARGLEWVNGEGLRVKGDRLQVTGYGLRVKGFFFLLLSLFSFPIATFAQEVLPADTAAVIGEGDELEPMDDIDVKDIGIPEWLTSHFVNDTLYINCESEALPRKLVVKTNDTDVVYRMVPQFMLGDTTLLHHHPADSLYHCIWTDNHVNPYGTLFDSLKDDVIIPMKGFRVPAPGYITSHYGWRRYRMHKGTDIKVLIGDSIRAAWDGQVRIVGWDPRGYGYFVVLRHDNGLETIYGHLSRPLVDEYEKIYAGEVIGLGVRQAAICTLRPDSWATPSTPRNSLISPRVSRKRMSMS